MHAIYYIYRQSVHMYIYIPIRYSATQVLKREQLLARSPIFKSHVDRFYFDFDVVCFNYCI